MEQENNSKTIMTDYANDVIELFDHHEFTYSLDYFEEKQVILLKYIITNGPEITFQFHFNMDISVLGIAVGNLFEITDKAMLPYFYELVNTINGTQWFTTFGVDDDPYRVVACYNMPVQEHADASILLGVFANIVQSCEDAYHECMKLTLL